MTFFESSIVGGTLLVAGIASVVRFKKIDRAYYPFLICIWVACINEITVTIMGYLGYYSSVNNNLYVLFEALLYLYFFSNIGVFNKPRGSLFRLLFLIIILSWCIDNLFFKNLFFVSSYYRIIYSFIIVLLSISKLNQLMIAETGNLQYLRTRQVAKPVYLITVPAIIFFTYKILVEIFWLYGLNASKGFRTNVYDILRYIDLFTNLAFAAAILWIPRKKEYILLS